tara:strand:- start:81 stop:965 length:885 start_codon:yes stop_codon:yes gene_type:complete
MSNDMKLIMESWRSSHVLTETKQDLFEDIKYIQEVLGIKIPLNENNEFVLSEELKKEIILRENAFQNFFKQFNPIEAVKKYGQEIGDLFSTLHDLVKSPENLDIYIGSVHRKVVSPILRKITKLNEWTLSKGMTKVSEAINNIRKKMAAVVQLEVSWKKAILITGLVVGAYYLLDELKGKGIDMATQGWSEISKVLTGFDKDKLQNILMNFFMKEMPKIATKLFGLKAVAASTGFVGFIVLIVPFIKVLNIAKEVLKEAILRFKRRSKRRDDRAERVKQAKARGETGIVLELEK